MSGATLIGHVLLVWWPSLHQWAELLSSIGYGLLSSIIPLFHTEAFIVAAAASGLLGPVELAIGLSVGNAVGKALMFLAVRHGKSLPWMRDREPKPVQPGSWRDRWRRWSTRTAKMVENPKWGFPILFVSACTGVPPLYPVALFAAGTKMNFWWFSIVMLVGFFIRCLVLALATMGAFQGIFG